mmetsp:Transcript_17086/g.37159  ORF Transcript_17086/g.37159 Transcript_17086/m.37159 type:complete len:278 (-) Transcript_17086:450-1283(-)
MNSTAFVGIGSSSFTGNVKSELAQCRRSAPASVTMALYSQTGLSKTGFRSRAIVKTAGAALEKADEYFAATVTRRYKKFAVPTGVYTPQCTEGNVKGQAEEKRNAALSKQFRMNQRSAFSKAHDRFENRKQALIAAHGCSAEEKLLVSNPKLAAAYVLGQTEAMRTCSRYYVPESIAEEYMAAAVDKQMKMRGVPGGVYSLSCAEGTAKGQAEAARVAALGTAFRTAQVSESTKAAARYDSAAYGRNHFGHGCEHEEMEFNTYPACAAAMRSSAYGY